ncbi:hypothetical protein NPIL_224011 [Nephila pilipes]|uniref:Uncharacterized protein n=1 Tax=Nephila pilipes TaxID=299642 RepID=A0A8X6PLT6_NEPPI|nr:hypothetical protein NPIL_224011 [Nephila pilipes]
MKASYLAIIQRNLSGRRQKTSSKKQKRVMSPKLDWEMQPWSFRAKYPTIYAHIRKSPNTFIEKIHQVNTKNRKAPSHQTNAITNKFSGTSTEHQ